MEDLYLQEETLAPEGEEGSEICDVLEFLFALI